MSKNKEITVVFEIDQLNKLNHAKALFEQDTKKVLTMNEFIDILVEAYLSYRRARGTSESNLLQKMAKNSR